MHLNFTAEGQTWPLRLTGNAERTRQALLDNLPMKVRLHTPKIAGSHIYWHAPFVQDVEGGSHVLSAAPGAFIFWPVRQFLEIVFAPLQAENAEITVLGHLDAPIEGIADLAATLKRQQGHRLIEGTLSHPDAVAAPALEAPPLPAGIVASRKALWADCPRDISALVKSRAIMHPAGPVFAAESEARILHELLWWVRSELGRRPENVLRGVAAIALNKAATRLRDFCHMQTTSDLLFLLQDAMEQDFPFTTLLDETILVAGGIGAWIDLLIPWNDVNEAFRAAID